MQDWLEDAAERFRQRAPAVDSWSLRLVDEYGESLVVRQDVLQPPHIAVSAGALVSVTDAGGSGYAATGDLSQAGLAAAADRARQWAHRAAANSLVAASDMPCPDTRGHYATPVEQPWNSVPLDTKVALLQDACRALNIDPRIVDWRASLAYRRTDSLLTSSAGAHIAQRLEYLRPGLVAVANRGARTQQRSGAGAGSARQGGLEQLQALEFPDRGPRLADEALALLEAPPCPQDDMDLVLLPSQMALQIHESIGHPLELDRILGDERNFAGGSFVTRDMFGSYRYGSELLNVTFDPGHPEQLASYGFDDDGTPARRAYLIRDGILERPLGGACSQARAALPGTASARASDWFRPPIDRMANLNVEPGSSTLEELVGSVRHGVLMDTNRSWSIDDSRNKFQFGCELGRLIEDGELRGLVRNPNYRGISATFWRSLDGVGNADSWEIGGVTNCGKGEPNQMIHVGHGAPACLFRQVAVFGGMS
ncbi:MAG: TldD/PmbA family protein [Gammaproteobacteria bacterium]